MKSLTCAAARRRLQAFHDGELAVGDQIAVAWHLEACRDCADALADIRLVSHILRATSPGLAMLSREEAAGFQAGVVSRVRAECDSSLAVRVRGMFEDMHLVYAGLGAAVATMVCVVIMLGMMRFATNERPDSLAAMVALLAMPGSSANAMNIDPASQARWTARFEAANDSGGRRRGVRPGDHPDTRRTNGQAEGARQGRAGAHGHRPPESGRETDRRAAGCGGARAVRAGAGRRVAGVRQHGLAGDPHDRAGQSDAGNVDLPLPAEKKRAAS